MLPFISAILLASASLTVAFDPGKASLHARPAQHPRNAPARSPQQYTLVDHYGAEDFMNESLWSYFTGRDPTDGQTKYLSHADAAAAGLAYVQDAKAILAVDSTNNLPLGANRDSVRITSTKAYNGGLFIADFAAMAHGCAVWPAYWSVGSHWPKGGEIDIVEGVNLKSENQYTLHTGPDSDCVLMTNLSTTSGGAPYTGQVLRTECASSKDQNGGCAFLDTTNTSFGHNFNVAGGGVFAHLWDSSGLQIWHFVRDSIPEDIQSGHPDPSSWTAPVAFCGGWASGDYPNSGCPADSSDQIAIGKNFLRADGRSDAKWVINYIAVYQ
ncbi:concanavalin A-like lectin/glucanase domain-containing protein [Lactarius quietus]|nr:concanavalin A-like lectin/glucanase domain-containing protein [Lactarius quietus]